MCLLWPDMSVGFNQELSLKEITSLCTQMQTIRLAYLKFVKPDITSEIKVLKQFQ
jgi:hypothetical protein